MVAAVALILRRWRLGIAALIVTFADLEPVIKSLVVHGFGRVRRFPKPCSAAMFR